MNGLDLGFAKIKEIFGTAAAIRENIATEEDAKLQIISRVLIEALGWDHRDISAEKKNTNGFSDYIVSDLTQPAFVVEAKRIGRIPIGTQATKRQEYKISGPALKAAFPAIEQAASYCTPLGIQLAVLTDGHVWIVFKPFIPGAPHSDKQAFVFPSFDAVQSDFATFYELLSKETSRLGTYKLLFDKIHENRLFVTQPMRAVINDSDLRIEHKSALAFDLDQVVSRYFSTLEGQDDEDMGINCFVETNESRVADFSLEKITANVLGNIVNTSTTVDESLKSLIVGAITADVGETVFIVGPTGAGKTTFLDRFFKRTLSMAVRELCVIVKVNALDASGDDQTSVGWMTNTIIKSIEGQLFENGNPEWNDLQALYQGEYVRRSIGVDAILYNRDKNAFKEKFGPVYGRASGEG
jgi:ABC-type multidrug transport system fused ATPase/permease subunit